MSDEPASGKLYTRHLRTGWWLLLFYLSLGMLLELMHGLKLVQYLGPANEVRRLLLTLAHAHGTLLAVVNLVFALFCRELFAGNTRRAELTSRCYIGAAVLIPAGFLFGGLGFHEGDPGAAVLLVPAGAVMLFTAVFCCARAAR